VSAILPAIVSQNKVVSYSPRGEEKEVKRRPNLHFYSGRHDLRWTFTRFSWDKPCWILEIFYTVGGRAIPVFRDVNVSRIYQ